MVRQIERRALRDIAAEMRSHTAQSKDDAWYDKVKWQALCEQIDVCGQDAGADEYQNAALKFAQYGGNAMYPALGLCEEAGEVAGKVAKFIRHNGGMDPDKAQLEFGHAMKGEIAEFRESLKKELGDVCWMVAALAAEFGLTLGDVMNSNIEKLAGRAERGTIDGQGDNR